MNGISSKFKRGVSHPHKIPPYVIHKLFPAFADRHGIHPSNVMIHEDHVSWRLGGFVQGAHSRPEFCARQYYEVRALGEVLNEVGSGTFDRALEIGCGYGRVTAWIDDFAAETHGIDPNEDVIEEANALYPNIGFRTGLAQELPYETDSFDLLVTWTTLQSISPDAIDEVAAEMRRVLAPGGVLVIAEQVSKPDRKITWSRSEAAYEQLFAPLELSSSRPRPVEPTFDPEYGPKAVFDEISGQTVHPLERILAFSHPSEDRT